MLLLVLHYLIRLTVVRSNGVELGGSKESVMLASVWQASGKG